MFRSSPRIVSVLGLFNRRRKSFMPSVLTLAVVSIVAAGMCAAAQRGSETGTPPEMMADANAPVTVSDDGKNFILSNGYVTATINKISGDMLSLKVKGIETQGYVSGHHAGYWEQSPAGAARMESKVTIDPAANGGDRAEVSIKGWSDGKGLNSGGGPRAGNEFAGIAPGVKGNGMDAASEGDPLPASLPPGVQRNRGTQTGRPAGTGGAAGARPGGGGRGPGLQVDMEIRYTMERGGKGIYTYAIFTHQPSYAATQIGESRYGMKLNGGVFDWLSIDAQRNGPMPNGADWDKGTDLNMKEARRMTTGVRPGRWSTSTITAPTSSIRRHLAGRARSSMWGFTSSILQWSTCRADRTTLS